MARICLITPGHLSTNPRIVKEADALSAAGHVVFVIATNFLQWAQEADSSFAGRGWHVEKGISFGPMSPFLKRIKQAARQRIARTMAAVGIQERSIQTAACHPIAPELLNAACSIPADLYVAHYVASLPAAAYAAKANGANYAYDAEDYHLGDLADAPGNAIEKDLIRAIETRYLSGCAYVTAASPGIADAYVRTYGISRPTVILNVFDRVDRRSTVKPPPRPGPGPSLYWFSQTIGPDRGLECAIRAIGRSKIRPHLYLRGNISRETRDHLMRVAEQAGVHERVHVLPPGRPDQMTLLASQHDIGLVAETGVTINRKIALTNKQFTYLAAGIPVLMSDIPAHRDLSLELGDAAQLFPINDADSLAAAMDVWLMDVAALKRASRSAYRIAQSSFNWETESLKFINVVSKMGLPKMTR